VSEPRFRAGDAVRARVANPDGHTRIPTYVRGRVGRVESVRRSQPLPDDTVRAARKGPALPVYGVAFAMRDLWGPDAEPGGELVMELWEPYIEPADDRSPRRPGEQADTEGERP
jgi:nitrile hydratase subunit beta